MKKILPLLFFFASGTMFSAFAQEADTTVVNTVSVPTDQISVEAVSESVADSLETPEEVSQGALIEQHTTESTDQIGAEQSSVDNLSVPIVDDSLAVEQSAPVLETLSEEDANKKEEEAEEEMWFASKAELYGRSVKRTWEYRLALAFNTSTGTSAITSDESGGVDFGIGYNLTGNIYAGILTGYWHDFGGVSGHYGGDVMPALGNLQLRFNLRKRLSFYVEGYAGILLQLKDDYKEYDGSYYEYPNYLYYGVDPGLMFRFGKKLDFRVSVGYGYAIPINEMEGYEDCTYDETLICIKAGFAYRFK